MLCLSQSDIGLTVSQNIATKFIENFCIGQDSDHQHWNNNK
jgi:hypothetical protein